MTTGGNGEVPSHMLREEKKAVTAAIVEEAAGAIPIIAGTRCRRHQGSGALGSRCERGWRGWHYRYCAVLLPGSQKMLCLYTTRRLHVKWTCRWSCTTHPLYTGNEITPGLIDRLAAVPNVIGLKQSNADFGILMENIRMNGDKVAVLTGIDSQFYAAMASGATGIFSTAACVIPREMVAIYDLVQAGDFAGARQLQLKLQALNRYLEYDPGYVGPCKAALRMLGLPAGPVRGPLPEVTPDEEAGVRSGLEALGLLA